MHIAVPQALDVGLLGLPAALARLPQLHRCFLVRSSNEVLPAGPWLARLRFLSAAAGTFISSTALLSGAAALEVVKLDVCGQDVDWGSPAAAAFFGWLAQHPPLRHVLFSGIYCIKDFGPGFQAHLALLLRSRPALEVQVSGGGHASLYRELAGRG